MSEMVAKVARAIEGRWHQGAINSLDLARAAIAAMREPTQDMIDAADDLNGSALFYKHYATCQDHWAAMIDTALHGPVPATADPIGFDLPQGERE
jgi:hypothetical protein